MCGCVASGSLLTWILDGISHDFNASDLQVGDAGTNSELLFLVTTASSNFVCVK